MPIVLNEFVGFDPKNPKESSRSQNIILPQHLTETAHEAQPDTYFTAKIEAIHADFGTRNFTRYTEDSIRKAVESWTNPYYAPVIMYHNDYDGQVIGRVMKAELAESTKMQGRCLLLTASIPDWHSEEGIRNGILSQSLSEQARRMYGAASAARSFPKGSSATTGAARSTTARPRTGMCMNGKRRKSLS